MEQSSGKGMRIVAIVFMGMTAAMNILGGIGTVCAAFLTKDFPPMWVFYDYQWQYQVLMITTILIGIAGTWVTIKLVKGGPKAFRNALIILVVGTAVSATQYFASVAIRGKGVPANIKFYTNAVTLLIFLILALPSMRKKVDFSKPMSRGDKSAASGLTAFIAGVIMLTINVWVGTSHTFLGANWVDVLKTPLIVGGSLLTIGGFVLMLLPALAAMRKRQLNDDPKSVLSR